MQAICNAFIFDGTVFHKNSCVVWQDGFIHGIVAANELPAGVEVTDAGGNLLVPAFIDLQIYGGNGKLFSHELSFAAIDATDDYSVAGGCSRFLITVATNSLEKILTAIEIVRTYQQQHQKGLLGLHLEGPYINPIKRGAHLEQHIRQATIEELQLLITKAEGVIKMITLATELCSNEVLALLKQHSVVVSAGHSNATYEQATHAFNSGITTATHLFNAMSPLQSREPGMVGAIYNHAAVMSSIVCDGVHTDFASVSISKKMMKERLFLITDAVTETTGEYSHVLNKDHYILPNGTLSGSALTMIKAVNNCVDSAGISLEESLRMASLYPAAVAGLQNQFGKIEKGLKADFVLLSNDKKVKQVYRNGNCIMAV
jgi:N-acetylglucosamine-6-phosphate deacetylase